ncbi:MAG: ATP-binding protein [Thermoguttaceae bacterium]|jgi:hypothetical protein
MILPENYRQVCEKVEQAAKRAVLDPNLLNNPDFTKHLISETLSICHGNSLGAIESLALQAMNNIVKSDQLEAAIKDFERKIREQPVPMLVLSRPFDFGVNGDTRKVIYAARSGGGIASIVCVALQDGQTAPGLFQWCFTDVEGKMWLGTAPPVPQQLEEHIVLRAEPQSAVIPELASVIVSDGTDHGHVLFAMPELAKQIGARIDQGEQVKVQHNGILVYGITETKLTQYENWIEFPSREGPTLAQMFFPRQLANEWEMDVKAMALGDAFMVVLQGPTGVGKTSGVIAAARTAAQLSGKPFVIINVSPSTVASQWYSVTEHTIKLAINRAKALAEKGYIVVILLDEMNALLGDGGMRYEGNVDHRVRLTLQSEFSNDIKGVAVYGTMNVTRFDWLPTAVARRFIKRSFPRTGKTQLARAAALYADPQVLAKLSLTPEEFGNRVGDFVFSNSLVIWMLRMQSGAAIPIRARDLHECSIGKIKSLIQYWCRQVRYDQADSLQALWARISTEFSGIQLNENNVFDSTFIRPPPHDKARLVEPVRQNGAPVTEGVLVG